MEVKNGWRGGKTEKGRSPRVFPSCFVLMGGEFGVGVDTMRVLTVSGLENRASDK